MGDEAEPGPWGPFLNRGYGTQYWALRRDNAKFFRREEILMTRACRPRRFGSELAAQKVADDLNKQAFLDVEHDATTAGSITRLQVER